MLASWIAVSLTFLAATLAAAALAQRGFPLPDTRQRIGCIDGLRGYLAVAVFASHALIWLRLLTTNSGWARLPSHSLDSLGSGGVSLFFMTTGLLFYPKIRAGIGGRSWRDKWLSIWLTRIFRIEPLLGASVFFLALSAALATPHLRVEARDVRETLAWSIAATNQPNIFGRPNAAVMNAYVLWTLQYEWLFYFIVMPIGSCIFTVFDKFRSRYVIMSIMLIILMVRHYYQFPMSRQLPFFVSGMIAWEIQSAERVRLFLRHRSISIISLVSLGLAISLGPDIYSIGKVVFYSLFFISISAGNNMFGVLKNSGCLVLGECSYSIYLLHGILLYISMTHLHFLGRTAIFFWMPAIAAVVTFVSAVAYHYIEKPADTYGRRLAKRLFIVERLNLTDQQLETAP